jgi:hypothetical protein
VEAFLKGTKDPCRTVRRHRPERKVHFLEHAAPLRQLGQP